MGGRLPPGETKRLEVILFTKSGEGTYCHSIALLKIVNFIFYFTTVKSIRFFLKKKKPVNLN